MTLSLPPALALCAIAFPLALPPPPAPPLPPDPPAPRVDLCEIVKDPQRFAGKLIRTEGEVFLGMGALGNKQCPPMRTGAHVWPPAVHLAGPPHKELDAAIAAASRSNTRLCAAITGTLRAKDKYLVAQTPSGPMGMGFGHLSIYPAQLEIVSATVQPGCPDPIPQPPKD